MLIKQKRGLSDVVTTALIILLAIAALVIVWVFVRPLIQRGGSQIGETELCASTLLEPISCTITSGVTVVSYKSGNEKNVDFKLIGYKLDGTTTGITDCNNDLNAFEQETCDGTDNSDYVAVTAVINGKVCPGSSLKISCV